MTKRIKQLWKGEKPSDETLKLADELMHDYNIPIGHNIYIDDKPHFMRDVGDIINVKLTFTFIPLTRFLVNKPILDERDNDPLLKSRILIKYWYAQKWLPPMRDYADLPPFKRKPQSKTHFVDENESKMYLKGAKPDEEIIPILNNYLKIMDSFNDGNGSGFMRFKTSMHGAQNISNSSSPVEKLIKNINGARAKLAKSFWKLEFAQNKQEVDRIYRECSGLINYWNMKEWIKFPGLPHF